MKIKKHLYRLFVGIIGIHLFLVSPVFAGSLTDFSHTADTWEPGATATHTFTFTTATDIPANGLISIQTSGFDMHYYNGATFTVNGGPNILYSYSGNGYLGANTIIAAGSVIVVTTTNPNATAGTYSLTFRTEDNSHNPIDTVTAPSFTIVSTRHGGYSPPLPDPVPEVIATPIATPVAEVTPVEPPTKEVFSEPVDRGTIPSPTTTPVPPTNSAPTACRELLSFYVALGKENDVATVKKIQYFLNTFEGEKLIIDGIYKESDYQAVIRFQEKYSDKILGPWNIKKGTGNVYKTTIAMINKLWCEKV